jgi:hypothetical protein
VVLRNIYETSEIDLSLEGRSLNTTKEGSIQGPEAKAEVGFSVIKC